MLVITNFTAFEIPPQLDDVYAHNLQRAAVHAAQSRLHLARALRVSPQRNRRLLEAIEQGQQLAIELLRAMPGAR